MRQALWRTIALVTLLSSFLPLTLAAEPQNQMLDTTGNKALTPAQSILLDQLQTQMQAHWKPATKIKVAEGETSAQTAHSYATSSTDQYAKLTKAILNLNQRLTVLESKEKEENDKSDLSDLKAQLDSIKASVEKLQQDIQKNSQETTKLEKQMKPTNILYGF
jgi:chromosome segregation ATPase